MGWSEAFDELGVRVASRAQLMAAGATGRGLTTAVRLGALVRLRRDHYALPDAERTLREAVRVGGRLACVSALQHHGVFAMDDGLTHVHLPPNAARLRSARNRRVPLRVRPDGVELHWRRLQRPDQGTEYSVGVIDALAQATLCRPAVLAVASIDNALHLGAVEESDVRELFAALPRRARPLRGWVDGRAEAGQETVLRRLVHDAGLHYEVQVEIDGVGRVDLVVEGRLVLEADSRLAHAGWEQQVRDRRRDLLASALGYQTLRPAYEHTMFEPGLVLAALRGALAARVHNSGQTR